MAILKVPSQYPTIQSAFDAVANGDTILIECGTYEQGGTLTGKSNITIKGIGSVCICAPPQTTTETKGIIIQGNQITVCNLTVIGFTVGIAIIGNQNIITRNTIKDSIKIGLLIRGQKNCYSYNIAQGTTLVLASITGGNNKGFNNLFASRKNPSVLLSSSLRNRRRRSS